MSSKDILRKAENRCISVYQSISVTHLLRSIAQKEKKDYNSNVCSVLLKDMSLQIAYFQTIQSAH